MERPLSDKRPIGPVFQSTGECKLRAKFNFTSATGPVDAKQSYKVNIKDELENVLPISNLTVNTGEFGEVEVSFDIEKKTLHDEEEDKIERAIGRALMDAGADNVRADGYRYTVVSR